MHHRMEKDTPRSGLNVPVAWIQELTATKEEIKGRDSTLRDYTVADNNGELDDEEVKAVRQDACAARRAWVEYSRRRGAFIDVRARKAYTDVTHDHDPDSDEKIGGECPTECYGTDVWPYGEESPLPPASDDARATGRTYDEVTKLPPPHLRYVVSPLPAVPPVLRCTAAPLPQPYIFLSPTSRDRGGFRPCSSRGCQSVVWCLI